jgi:hypothetical protein
MRDGADLPISSQSLRRRIALTAAIVAAFALRPEATVRSITADSMLRTYAKFTAADLRRIATGEVVAKPLAADDDEVAIGAAVRIRVPASFYIERFRAIETFKRDEAVLQVRRFGDQPSASDMASLELARRELDDLRACRADGCRIKLDASGLSRFASMHGAQATDQQVSAAFTDHLAAYSARYIAGGNEQLMEYRDREQPSSLLVRLSQILRCSEYLADGLPALATAIGAFNGPLPAGVEDFLYWSHDMVGTRPVVSITHSLITAPEDGVTAVATKQIYASHFFTASLGLTLLIEAPDATVPETLVVYINRSRVDLFEGLLAGAKRSIVRSRARSATARILRDVKSRLEDEFGRTSPKRMP